MKNEEWLNEKLVNFKSHIHENLRPPVDWTPEIKKNVDYVMNMSLDDWLKFASNHLMRFKGSWDNQSSADFARNGGKVLLIL